MTIDELSANTITGLIKIKLKDGQTLSGSIPFDSPVSNHLAFLPYKLTNEFNSKFPTDKKVLWEELKPYITILEKNNIESFEILERIVEKIVAENNKPLPAWLEITCTNNDIPGFLNVKYKIPETDKFFDLGELKIQNGTITLPIKFIFLSYAKEDKAVVKFVMNKLHDKGVITWFDEKDLLPGDDWEAKIEESIEKADHVFVFLSSKTADRDGYKNKEINYILDQHLLKSPGKRYVIPILIDEFTPPRAFKKIHWLKISEDDWMNKILKTIGKY